jgi:hypothetical protein
MTEKSGHCKKDTRRIKISRDEVHDTQQPKFIQTIEEMRIVWKNIK